METCQLRGRPEYGWRTRRILHIVNAADAFVRAFGDDPVMRFCPQCGCKLILNARFCAECGTPLLAATMPPTRGAKAGGSAAGGDAGASSTLAPFVAIFSALIVFGGLVSWLILRQMPARDALIAAAPPQAAVTTAEGDQLPANHPKVALPQDALSFIAQVESKARQKPQDLAAWDQLGDVTLRAAAFDPAYYAQAAEAYAHVLKVDPENADALRGIGNVDFDQGKPDVAIAAYEHYLTHKPDDPEVRTDMATMLLSSGAADAAIAQYKRVLEAHPDFFEANFNLGVAYGSSNVSAARAALDNALKLAPDEPARNRVNQMIASLGSASAGGGPELADGAASSVSAVPDTQPSPTNFREAIEQTMRDLPVAGDKVQSVNWDSTTAARVLMSNFPMEQMPPFAAAKFISDVKAGVDRAKATYNVTAAVRIDICDAAGGRVMQSVTE
jgi:tetratricopeptide (TPR) repeat protein